MYWDTFNYCPNKLPCGICKETGNMCMKNYGDLYFTTSTVDISPTCDLYLKSCIKQAKEIMNKCYGKKKGGAK